MVPLSEGYPIVHNHIVIDPNKSERPIIQCRHGIGQCTVGCVFFKATVSAKEARAGESNRN